MCWRVYWIYLLGHFFPLSAFFTLAQQFMLETYKILCPKKYSSSTTTELPKPLSQSHDALTPSLLAEEHKVLRNDATAHFQCHTLSWKNKILIPKVLKQETSAIYVIWFYSLRLDFSFDCYARYLLRYRVVCVILSFNKIYFIIDRISTSLMNLH